MILSSVGRIAEDFYNTGFAAIPIFLLNGSQPVLFDGGVTCGGRIYVEAIRSIVGKRQPAILFLTHAHWDHCGAVAYLKKAFPTLKIAASPLVSKILNNPKAVGLIQRLNNGSKQEINEFPGFDASRSINDLFHPFEVDIVLNDGQVVDLGDGCKIQVLASPGHTRDHISYYIPDKKLLIGGEAIGELDASGNMHALFVSNFEQYMSSLERLATLPLEILCQGHLYVITGREEIRNFFDRSIRETKLYKERILRLLDEEDGSIDRVIEKLAENYFTVKHTKQPEDPYFLNVSGQVKHLAAIRKR